MRLPFLIPTLAVLVALGGCTGSASPSAQAAADGEGGATRQTDATDEEGVVTGLNLAVSVTPTELEVTAGADGEPVDPEDLTQEQWDELEDLMWDGFDDDGLPGAMPGMLSITVTASAPSADDADCQASGADPAPVDFTILVSIDGGEWNRSQATVSVGTVCMFFDVSTLDPGEHLLEVVVDPEGVVAETDETDNRAAATITVLPAGGEG